MKATVQSLQWQTIAPAPAADRPQAHAALSNSAPLKRFITAAVTAGDPILLLLNDPHRPTQTRAVLSELARWLVRDDAAPRFRAIVATGTHRSDPRERAWFEQATFGGCGLEIADVTWHDARDAQSHVDIGGLRMHRRLGEHRFLLPVGSVEPHYFAGLTGPHKTVTIGCLSFADIEHHHAAALSLAADILKLEENPIHRGIVAMLNALKVAGKTIVGIGQIVRAGSVVETAAGDPVEILDALFPTVRRIYQRGIAEPADLVYLRVPLPLGRSFYQADKALKNNEWAVRDGGGIILEAACPDGIGDDAFLSLLRRACGHTEAGQIVARRGYRLGDHKAVRLWRLIDPLERGVRVAVVSPNLAQADLAETPLRAFQDAGVAWTWMKTEVSGPFERGLMIEDAGMLTVCASR